MYRAFFLALLVSADLAVADPIAPSSAAVSMDVAPTTLELVPGVPGLFYVSNHGAEATTVQIEGFDWSQSDGRDSLTPSSDLLISPSEAMIAPGARQLVRVLAPENIKERSFRLSVSQMPNTEDAAKAEAGSNNVVHLLLRFGVPVFASAQSAISSPVLVWTAEQQESALLIKVRNDGPHTVKLANLSLRGKDDVTSYPDQANFVYVLPGASHNFVFTRAPQSPGLRITAHDGRSGISIDAAIAPPH